MVNALLIENEKKLLTTLEEMLHLFCPQVIIRDKIDSLQNSATLIQKANPELIFLDIEKVCKLGVDVVGFFNKITCEVIFITAATQYAMQAI
ncbi:MAG: hypothetical protein KDC05_07950, partial [Bacteroidales bacterium]|nr:hypothetical protein [Bacteroidales bacterium]